MCALVGCILATDNGPDAADQANDTLAEIFRRSIERGRDGYGWSALAEGSQMIHRGIERSEVWRWGTEFFDIFHTDGPQSLIANLRAEPTTEYVAHKREVDQQPYELGGWTIVHNGTIANDAELRTWSIETRIDSAAIVEQLALRAGHPADAFLGVIRSLRGSYAILATHDSQPGVVYAACNYRPIWWATDAAGVFFASSRRYFPDQMVPLMIPPYSAWRFDDQGGICLDDDDVPERTGRALVVCSGGLDSVVAASAMIRDGYEVELLHFAYGSRAQGPERAAVLAVAARLGVQSHFRLVGAYSPADSPLLRSDSTIAGGEAGAEFAHEWVPARNLLMLSLATVMAEADGFDLIVLGNNLEEAGAYPDNEPEFIERFNDLLPFAVADGKRVRVVMPVGNLMKHEIVALGSELGAPLDLTWSCYRAGPVHCGTCGPCFMRRKAFEINGLPEVIQYASEGTN